MRFVDRSTISPPAILSSSEAESLRQDLRDYATSSVGQSSQRRAPTNRAFLERSELQESLNDLFEGRCAYCESQVEGGGLAPLEPHRPLEFAQSSDGTTDQFYYTWLTYDWDNMLWACHRCKRHKENRFFVEGERGYLGESVAKLRENENALLLDPCFDDPATHLEFLPDGKVTGLTPQGHSTIKMLALDREELTSARSKAVGEALARLSSDPESLAARATGASHLWSRVVVKDVAYPGATTIALLRAARDIHEGDLQTFISLIAAMPPAERQSLLNSLLDAKITLDAAWPPEIQAATSRSKHRVTRLNDMPAGRLPIGAVAISNFRGLRELNVELPQISAETSDAPPCMILLGENATGKSSVLEAIALALLGAQGAAELDLLLREDKISPQGLIHRPDPEAWEVVSTEPLKIDISYVASPFRSRLSGPGSAQLFDGTHGPSKIVLAYGPRRFFPRKATRRYRAPAYRVRSLFDPMATIPNPSDWLLTCPPSVFDAAARALREILMLRPEDYFQREDGRIVIETAAGRVRLEEMSVGYKSVIAMATDIMRELMAHYDNLEYAAATVLIDEIETHLHPRWKMQIMGRLRRAFPRVQFIVTTHDPLCLRGMHDGEVFVLRRREKDHQIERVLDVPAIRGMRAEQILTSEFFGLGSTDPETDSKLAVYHNLAGRIGSHQPEEERQFKRLREELQRDMVIGDTLQEQAVAEALKQVVTDSAVTPQKPVFPTRRLIIDSALEVLRATPQLGAMTAVAASDEASVAGRLGSESGQAEQEG
ncbi:hypothetical protein FJ987_16465 [Mesorhizobium sp. CU2]|uniref:AAA family ATPase n=1 Tax=unclassified Mesorhizobium TaxID=325217 RepID=UPI001127CE48|nr:MULTISPECIES: AAA family ATPase [unclassified Mesorhizobium]TPN82562.1 hypothetical protein FJ988_15515 [Mesorhizobium sp. CU3]TPO12767.1 hypothetical protein FJ987_16465 [Mesorhizobium sp. CU2]